MATDLDARATALAASDQARRQFLADVSHETRRLEHIIGDLLDLARLEGGASTLRRVFVDTRALVDRVALRHERELTERGVRLVVRVDPAAKALRHTPACGEITLAAEPAGAATRIVVRIAPDHLPLVFDRFYKADASRAGSGSRLGLSIVKAIVERHGGTITVRNDRGAVFEILIPSMDARRG